MGRAPRARRPRAAWVGALALGLALTPGTAGAAPGSGMPAGSRAAAAPGSGMPATPTATVPSLEIDLTSVSPAVVTDGASVRLSGRIRNTGSRAVSPGGIRLVASPQLTSAAQVSEWTAARTPAAGVPLASGRLPATLAPGQSASFRVSLTDPARYSTRPYGMLPVSLEAGGVALHTFVGFQRRKEYEPLRTAWLVPLTLPATPALWTGSEDARAAAWTSAVGTGSRIERIVRGTTETGVTWAVDPALLSPPEGTSGEAAVRSEAAERLRSELRGSRPVVLPVDDADLAATTARPSLLPWATSLVTESEHAAALVGGRRDVVWPADGTWSPARGTAYRRMYAGATPTVLVPTTAVQGTAPEDAARRATNGTPLLVDDPTLSGLAAAGGVPRSRAEAAQAFLAQTVLALDASPGLSRSLLVALPRTIDPDPAALRGFLSTVRSAPWLTADEVSALVGEARTTSATTQPAPVVVGVPQTPAPHTPLDDAAARDLLRLRRSATAAAAIRDDGLEQRARWYRQLDALLSTRWRGRTADWRAVRDGVAAQVRETTSAVHVAPQTINFLADRGRLQITVVNNLPVEVSGVRVRLVPANPRLRIDTSPAPLRIGPRSRTTVTFDATALAAGPVLLDASVTGPDGDEVGPRTAVRVDVTPTGNSIYWGLGGLTLLLLGLGLWRNHRRRRRPSPPAPETHPIGRFPAPATPETHPIGRFPAPAAPAPPLPQESGPPGPPTTLPDAAEPPLPSGPTDDPDVTREASGATVARSGVLMAAGTIASRFLGLVRSILLASVVGATGLTADAWDIANTLPNQFYLILAGGILNAVLVPQIVRASSMADGGEEFVNRVVTLAVTVFLGATILLTALAPVLIWAFFDTSNPGAIGLAVTFAYICLPQVFFYAVYTVLGQILNAHGRFGAYMWAPVVANVIALAGLVAFRAVGDPLRAPPDAWSSRMVWILAGSATLSIAVQAISLVPPLRRMGFRFRPVWGVRGVGLGAASKVAKWTFAAVVVSQLGFLVTTRVLSGATTRSHHVDEIVAGKATYTNAFLLFMVAHSVITVSLVTALFTRMSQAAAETRRHELVADVQRGLRMPAVILVPGVVFGVVFGPLITHALFFLNGRAETDAIASVMVPLMLGVIPYGWLYLSDRFFYAHEDARTPFLVQCVVTGSSTVITLLAALAPPRWTAPIVGLGQSTAYVLGAVVGFTLIRRTIGRLGLGGVVTAYLRLLIPSLLVAAVLYAVVRLGADRLADHRSGAVVLVTALGVLQLGLGLVGAHLAGVPEVRSLAGPVLRRVRRG